MTVRVKSVTVRVFDIYNTKKVIGQFESLRYLKIDDVITVGSNTLRVCARVETVTLDGEHFLDILTLPYYGDK